MKIPKYLRHKSRYKRRPYNKYRVYNTQNLKPFNSDTGSYYGKIGGFNSGKARLKNKIWSIQLSIAMDKYNLEPYIHRKRIYNREYDTIKQLVHNIKINTNRLNKAIDKYNKKYNI